MKYFCIIFLFFIGSKIFSQKKDSLILVVTIQNLIDYKNECYNDSTIHYYRMMCDWGCVEQPCDPKDPGATGFPGLRASDHPCSVKYLHRPCTFEGFIDALIKKLKNKK